MTNQDIIASMTFYHPEWNEYLYSQIFSPDNVPKYREMVLSIMAHVQNIHSFPNNKIYKKCAHSSLDDQANRQPWISEGHFLSSIFICLNSYLFP